MEDDHQEQQHRCKRIRMTTLDRLEEGRAVSPLLEECEAESSSNSNSSVTSFYSDDDEFFYADDIQYEFDDHFSYYEEEIEEDEIDPDELSYEELLALGDTVGVESRGLSEAQIDEHLRPLKCHPSTISLINKCVICQVEYEDGENAVTLHCDHIYHRDCIVKWLQINKICPICNIEL